MRSTLEIPYKTEVGANVSTRSRSESVAEFGNSKTSTLDIQQQRNRFKRETSTLRSVTCHMETHSVMPSDTGERAPPSPHPNRSVLDLPSPQGWKAELTLVLVMYRDGLSVRGQSLIQIVTT